MKICIKCSEEKDENLFYKNRRECKECFTKRSRKWRKNNPEKAKENIKKWRENNSEKEKETQKKWRKDNPERVKEGVKKWKKDNPERVKEIQKKYLENNPQAVLANNLRNRFRSALKKQLAGKRVSAVRDLGCSMDFFMPYIEKQFSKEMKTGTWMSWGNCGSVWHIDHKIPLSHFDLTKEEEQKKAVHYTNLQPLFEEHNLRKGNRAITL